MSDDPPLMQELRVKIPRPMKLDLVRLAQDEDSLASLVRRILRDYLRTHRDPVP
jgi:hypothetical protein